ncbi:ribokinase [Pleomorphomonas sp. JP5]|uniref:ribokinase n=1 Tax=Pleomorphomonas sp. JP5 TaxID=2942998 RepID=UPI002043EA7E|nr:ribokinase [Pleomorphomonas sp. JP5]MCM5559894.1 ribokinase [Pleomorphomonas sp. JP5]
MITVFGSVNIDLVATADRLPLPGETVAGRGFATSPGGKGANQALAARRAGAEVRFAGAVGSDDFAGPALACLRESGVDLSLVRAVSGPTGTAVILVDAKGENMITVIPGANGALMPADGEVAVAGLRPRDLLMLQLEIPEASVEVALSSARRAGVRTLLNLAPLTAEAARIGRLADIVVANETEFACLVGSDLESDDDRVDALRRLHAESGQIIVVTLGESGAIAISDGEIIRVNSPRIVPIDAVGAGDTFCGYLAAGLDAGDDFAVSLQRAAVAGAVACLSTGAQVAIPLRSAVDAKASDFTGAARRA